MKIRLWSIQEEKRIDELASSGELVTTENKYSMEWEQEYQWMIKHMKDKISKPQVKDQYPIWAWYQYQNKSKRKPDLLESGYLPKGTRGIRIEFEKNSSEVLLSDFLLWHFPLSYKSIIAANADEYDKFVSKLKKLKLDKSSFMELPSRIQNEIRKSWLRIFDLDFEDETFTCKRDEKRIQACCWEVKNDEIIRIDKFRAR